VTSRSSQRRAAADRAAALKPRRMSIEELNALLDALDPENASAVRRAGNNFQ
jgi:hypothetical protein